MIPYVEKIASDYLRDHPDVEALGARVVGKTPSSTSEPWVRVTQLDAANEPTSRPEHLIDYLIQFDCYAGSDGGQPEANLLTRTVRAALHDMPDADHDDAVVTDVRFTSMARIPDVEFEPARERFVLDATVYMHAV